MMDFTQDERNMMMLYSPGTRSGLCEALTLMKEQLSKRVVKRNRKYNTIIRNRTCIPLK